MNVTAAVRRNTLALFNVRKRHGNSAFLCKRCTEGLKRGTCRSLRSELGRRRYYRADDLLMIAERCEAKQNHP